MRLLFFAGSTREGSFNRKLAALAHHIAEANGIAVLTVIVDNAAYGAVRNSVLGLYPNGYASKGDEIPLTALSPSPDYVKVAEASRAYAESVRHGGDLPGALDRAIHAVTVERRQALLDVHVAA